MNIEESIIEFKKMIERDKDTLRYWKSDTFGHYDEPIKKLEKDVLISETLLTAYEKEKEENKRYEKYLKSKDKQHEQVLEYLETEKENEYISKEKIKERIKEYYEYDKRMQNKPDWHTTKYYEAKALEKLLEE